MLSAATSRAGAVGAPTARSADVLPTCGDAAEVSTDVLDRSSVAVVARLVVAAAHLAAEGRARVASLVELELQGLNALSPLLDFLFDFVEKAGSGVVFNAGWGVARGGALER